VSQTITQAEVDELIESIREDVLELEVMDMPEFDECVAYDFSRPHSLSRAFESNLATINDSFARQTAISLSNFYRSSVSVIPRESIGHVLLQDYIKKLSKPSCIAIVNMPPLRGQMIIKLGYSTVFALVDKLMGGSGEPLDKAREFTEIEFRVFGRIVDKVLQDFAIGSNRFLELNPSISRLENNPEFVNICSGMERVVSLEFDITMGETNDMMDITIPVSAFDPVIDVLDPEEDMPERSPDEKVDDARRLRETLNEVKLDIRADIGTTEIPIEEAKALVEGDVLVLNRKASEPVDILVEGLTKFGGIPGGISGRKAVKLVSIVKGDDNG